MSEETVTPPTPAPARRAKCWAIAAGALVVLGAAAWYFGVVRPPRQLAAQRIANARKIADLKLDLVWIAPGEFLMGSPERKNSKDNEWPMTRVKLTQPFWLGRTEVTQAQWTAVMGGNPSESIYKQEGMGMQPVAASRQNIAPSIGDNLPVQNVTWDDAMAFCQKLTERERTAGRLPADHAFILPTEAQWEYACRAGTTSDYAGDLAAVGWYAENSEGTTHAVGTKQANAWGFFDMGGNVWEWCRDWYGDYPGGSVTDPMGPTSGSLRVFRGSSWRNHAEDYRRSTVRNQNEPGHHGDYLGFRVALAPVK